MDDYHKICDVKCAKTEDVPLAPVGQTLNFHLQKIKLFSRSSWHGCLKLYEYSCLNHEAIQSIRSLKMRLIVSRMELRDHFTRNLCMHFVENAFTRKAKAGHYNPA